MLLYSSLIHILQNTASTSCPGILESSSRSGAFHIRLRRCCAATIGQLDCDAGIYDAADSKRFFVSTAYSSCGTVSCLTAGSIPIFSYLLVGVSKTSDPRDGFLGPYFIATDGIDPETNQAKPPPTLTSPDVLALLHSRSSDTFR